MVDQSEIAIFEIEEYRTMPVPCYDRDYFKVCILEPESKLHYAGKTVHITQPALIFSNPLIPYEWEPVSSEQVGYFCRFTEDFLDNEIRLQDSSLYKIGANSIFFPNERQTVMIKQFFLNMREELNGNYEGKNKVLRHYIKLLMHEAFKMEPNKVIFVPKYAATRITSLFLELLNRQFPIKKQNAKPIIRTPHEFANYLSVHINHLNDSVKKVTGKSTTQIIKEKLISESKVLLISTNWDIAEISYIFNFEYPNNFSKFFKSETKVSPTLFRG